MSACFAFGFSKIETWLTANISYAKHIEKRYGDEIYDLNSPQRAKIVEDVAEIVSEQMLRKLTN